MLIEKAKNALTPESLANPSFSEDLFAGLGKQKGEQAARSTYAYGLPVFNLSISVIECSDDD